MTVIPETRRVHSIRYLRFHYYDISLIYVNLFTIIVNLC